jgi:hypothetical protein
MIPVFWFRWWDSVVLLAVIDATIRSKLVKLRKEGKYQIYTNNDIWCSGPISPQNPQRYEVIVNGCSIAPEEQVWSSSFGALS